MNKLQKYSPSALLHFPLPKDINDFSLQLAAHRIKNEQKRGPKQGCMRSLRVTECVDVTLKCTGVSWGEWQLSGQQIMHMVHTCVAITVYTNSHNCNHNLQQKQQAQHFNSRGHSCQYAHTRYVNNVLPTIRTGGRLKRHFRNSFFTTHPFVAGQCSLHKRCNDMQFFVVISFFLLLLCIATTTALQGVDSSSGQSPPRSKAYPLPTVALVIHPLHSISTRYRFFIEFTFSLFLLICNNICYAIVVSWNLSCLFAAIYTMLLLLLHSLFALVICVKFTFRLF